MRLLHIHNGDISADAAREAGIPGTHIAWRESLVTGPTPAHPERTAWIECRAEHLSTAYGVDLDRCAVELGRQEQALDRCTEYDETVLWFDEDLFCQSILWYLLHRISTMTKANTVFSNAATRTGTGTTSPETFFAARAPLSDVMIAEGAELWRAYSSDNPHNLQTLLGNRDALLPGSVRALAEHAARFPAAGTGLGSIELATISHLHAPRSFADLFRVFTAESPGLGYGDAQLWYDLVQWSVGPHPLIAIDGVEDIGTAPPGEEMHKAVLRRLPQMERNPLGTADMFARNTMDKWLGGVHLQGNSTSWRWDPHNSCFLQISHQHGGA